MLAGKAGKEERKMRVDFTNVQTEFESIPEGWVPVNVFRHKIRKGKDSGENYIEWELAVQLEGFEKRKLWTNSSLQPQALWNLKKFLECIKGEKIPEGPIEFDPPDLYGKALQVKIEHEEYGGRTRERVVDFAPAEGVEIKESGGKKSGGSAKGGAKKPAGAGAKKAAGGKKAPARKIF